MKRAIVEALARCGAVQIHVDTTVEGVDVPVHLRDQSEVAIQVRQRLPTGDLIVGAEYLAQRIAFDGVAYRVRIPWEAVRAVRTKTSVTLFEEVRSA